MQKKWLFLEIFVLTVLLCAGLFSCADKGKTTVVPPNCLENGYTILEEDGKTQIVNIVPAVGHQFSDWVTLRETGEIACGLAERICRVCGEKETQSVYPKLPLPRLCFDGDASEMDKTHQVKVRVDFFGNGIDFDGYALLKNQGHSSLQYDKKNLTVKFFADENCEQKQRFIFWDWNPEHKFILKANYIDVSRCRNLICSDIWSRMVSTRENVPDRLRQTSNNGAVDGFPVAVYFNGSFYGLYQLTLHKDDDLFSMKEGRKDGLVITNKGYTAEAMFRQTVDWKNTNDWEVEYCGTENEDWIKEKLNRFITFVTQSSDEDFKNRLSEYADVDSLIDYMIAAYSLGLPFNFSKDLLLATYDDGVWVASLFDMETAFGLTETGCSFSSPQDGLPFLQEENWRSGTDSLLWDRFIAAFYGEIAERYRDLRRGILRENDLAEVIKQRIEAIPQNLNDADADLYPRQPAQDVSHSEQIQTYVNQRLALLDEIFGNAGKGE